MKKRRRLRKPIRLALRFAGYAAVAILADLTAIGAILYYFGDLYILSALGVCLGLNVGVQYVFFKGEFYGKKANRWSIYISIHSIAEKH